MLNNSLITISELVYVCVRVHVCKNVCGRICVVLPIYRPPMIHGIDFQRKLWFFFFFIEFVYSCQPYKSESGQQNGL